MAAGYTKEEMDRMQNDAIRRVRAMQERAERARSSPPMPDFVRPLSDRQAERRSREEQNAASGHRQDEGRAREEIRPQGQHKQESLSSPKNQSRTGNLLKMLNFKGIEIDSDRSLILMMLALLSGDSDDELLMLALLYIML